MVAILNCATKRGLEQYCRTLVIQSSDLAAAIFFAQAGVFEPYKYASCFREWSPAHLKLTEEDRTALVTNGVGPLQPAARKTLNKVHATFHDRRMLAAHLLYTPDFVSWFVFFFDQRDVATRNQHWKHGPHIHLVSSHWPNLRLDELWREVREGRPAFASKLHVRYRPRSAADPP